MFMKKLKDNYEEVEYSRLKIFKDVSKGNKDADIKVISLGVGVQSTAVYLMSSMEYKMPRADVAIFSDPGAEGESTYAMLKWLKSWEKENNGIPIIVTNEKNLYKDIIEQEGTDKKISLYSQLLVEWLCDNALKLIRYIQL